jgi:EmrB/QacA subfamily drug resistance transporter
VDTATDTRAPSRGRMYLILVGVMLAMLLAMLDNMIVNTALPRIVGDLGGLAHYSWVVTAYILASTAATPIWGKLGDLFGQKRTYLASIVLFLAGSALSGMAHSMTQLIAFRAFQGLGAGGLMVGAMAIMGVLVPPRERGRYQGVMAAIMPAAMVAGPLLGGFITDHLNWRWAFYVNLPIGVVALAMIIVTLHLPKVTHAVRPRIDYLGAALLTAGVSALVLITTWGGSEYAWGSPQILGLAAAAALALAAFVLVERRVAEPILPLRLFRSRNFTVAAALGFLTGFAMFGATLAMPQFFQTVQGDSATASGLSLLPMLGGMVVVGLIAGQVMTRTGRYKAFPIIGGVLMAAGLLLLSRLDVGTGHATTLLLMVPLGLGLGCLMQVVMTVAQNTLEVKDMGAGSAASRFFQSIGGSFGASVFGAVMTSRLTSSLTDSLGAPAADKLTGSGQRTSPAILAQLPAVVHDAYLHAVADGVGTVFLWAVPVAVLVFLVAWFVKEVPLRGSATPPQVSASKGSAGERNGALAAVADTNPRGPVPALSESR